MAPLSTVRSVSSISAKGEKSFKMRSILFIALIACILAIVIAAPHKGTGDRFVLPRDDCGPYGTLQSDGDCECELHFSGDKCDIYHSRRCTKDYDCGSAHAYCAHKLAIQCRFSTHCKDPSGWCMPLDPAL